MKTETLNKIEEYIIAGVVFLFPLVFFPNISNIFETPKLIFLFVSTSILVIIKVIKTIKSGGIVINSSNFDFLVALLATLYILSTIFSISNKFESMFLPGSTSFVILFAIIFFFINQTVKQFKNTLVNIFLASIFGVAFIQIGASLGIFKFFSFLPEVIKIESFSTTGTLINTIVLFIGALPFLFYKLFKKSDLSERVLSGLVIAVILVSLSSSLYNMLKIKNLNYGILDYKHGWSIATDTLKNHPFFGAGPTNFSYAFNRYKPLTFNNGNDWNINYIQSSSSVLTMISEVGLPFLLLFIYLIYLLVRNRTITKPAYVALSLVVLSSMFLPITTSFFIFLLLFLLSLIADVNPNKKLLASNKVFLTVLLSPAIFFILISSYFLFRAVYAEILFAKVISYSNSGQIVKGYENINKVVKINPYNDDYHLVAADINIAIATSYAQKENLSDEDRNNISRLLQQALNAGKAAVAVSKHNSNNWEGLSKIYQLMMPFTKDAEKFAIESLRQSIALNPIDPNLRIKLGGIYYTYENYDSAIDSFKLAVLAKPNLANSHYNLAMAYKASNNNEKAKEEMNITLNLLGKESESYEKALMELKSIQDLTEPEEKVEPMIEPQIDLPQEEGNTEPQI